MMSVRSMLLVVAFVFASSISTVGPCFADDAVRAGGPSGARTKQQFEGLMADQWKHMVRGTTAALSEPKTAADLAAFTRNYYEALVKQGFSEAEALALVGRVSFPIGGSSPRVPE